VNTIGVIEVGGTHATATLIAPYGWTVHSQTRRVELDSHADATDLLDKIALAADGIEAPVWGVAMPDPFDYPLGIGRFRDVGKFSALDEVDVRAGLAHRLQLNPAVLSFCNDADAFTLGEWAIGAGHGFNRVVGLTLGTGVGSGWTVDGQIADPGNPPGGRIHQVRIDGRPLEETMSRRAIRSAYGGRAGDHDADVREIAERAADGDQLATEVLQHALDGLGRAIAGPIDRFAADVLVVGGSMAQSWRLFEPWVLEGWATTGHSPPVIRVAEHPEDAPLVGAAIAATA